MFRFSLFYLIKQKANFNKKNAKSKVSIYIFRFVCSREKIKMRGAKMNFSAPLIFKRKIFLRLVVQSV